MKTSIYAGRWYTITTAECRDPDLWLHQRTYGACRILRYDWTAPHLLSPSTITHDTLDGKSVLGFNALRWPKQVWVSREECFIRNDGWRLPIAVCAMIALALGGALDRLDFASQAGSVLCAWGLHRWWAQTSADGADLEHCSRRYCYKARWRLNDGPWMTFDLVSDAPSDPNP